MLRSLAEIGWRRSKAHARSISRAGGNCWRVDQITYDAFASRLTGPSAVWRLMIGYVAEYFQVWAASFATSNAVGTLVRPLYMSGVFLALATYAQTAEISSHVTLNDPSSSRGETVVLKLEGRTEVGDDTKFLKAYEAVASEENLSTDMRGNIILSLNSPGGELYSALGIARMVRDFKITTFVDAGSVCKSACAFIFFAGSRIGYYGDDALPERIFDVHSDLAFHAPYHRTARGTFEEGRRAVKEIGSALEGSISVEFLNKILAYGRHDYWSPRTIGDVGVWNFQIAGYVHPTLTREGMLNACINEAAWGRKRPLGPLQGGEFPEEALPESTDEHSEGDLRGLFIPNGRPQTEYKLLEEDSPDLVYLRDILDAPDLLRLANLQDGSSAIQFVFDHGDEMAQLWCTAIRSADGDTLYISNEKFSLTQGSIAAAINEAVSVPDWYMFHRATPLKLLGVQHEN